MKDSTAFFIIFASMCLIAAAGFFILEFIKERKLTNEASATAIENAQAICMKILTHSGLMLFTEAERQYGSGTGSLKLSSVITQVIAMLPDWVKEVVDMNWLIEQIEAKLTEAKKQWEANDKLLG